MRILNISTNQNFTALKYKRGSQFYLNKLSKADKKALAIAEQSMKNYKHVDLNVGLRGMKVVPKDNRFFEENWANVLEYRNLGIYCQTNMAIYGNSRKNEVSTVLIPFLSYDEAKSKAAMFDELSDVEKSIELAKELENFCDTEIYYQQQKTLKI